MRLQTPELDEIPWIEPGSEVGGIHSHNEYPNSVDGQNGTTVSPGGLLSGRLGALLVSLGGGGNIS